MMTRMRRQVVLPLLLNEVTQYEYVCIKDVIGKQLCEKTPDYKIYPPGDARVRSWVTEEQFLAGLAISQVSRPPVPLRDLRGGRARAVMCTWVGVGSS